MKTSLKGLFVAVIVMMFCLPVTAFAKPHSNHSNHSSVVYHQRNHNVKKHVKHRHHSPPPPRQCGMTNSDFSTFLSYANKKVFYSDKKEMILEVAASNSFTVDQVIRTLELTPFTIDKIDIAAALYNSVCDYNNWYKVYSVFTFNSDVKKLKAKIGQA